LIGLESVVQAHRRLEGVSVRTPIFRVEELDRRVGSEVFLKIESFQRTGAFKFRGAYTCMAALTRDRIAAGVIAASSGNHAAAVALSARLLGTTAVLMMPADASDMKVDLVNRLGGKVLRYDRYGQDRESLLRDLALETGRTIVHGYDDWQVIAGQGTVALELFEAEPVRTLVVPVGGGGLVAGCAIVAHALDSKAVIVGVEPEMSDDVRRSLACGRRVRVAIAPTIADGQQLPTPGQRPFEVIQRHVDDVVLVTDAEIVEAMRFLFENFKVVSEASGATALAALLTGRFSGYGRRVGVVVSGGNVSLERFVHLISTHGGGITSSTASAAERSSGLARALGASAPPR
jgi:threonine dehydratase